MFVADEKYRRYGRTPQRSIEELRTCLNDAQLDGVLYVVLFGSRVAGEASARSDYDLAVYAVGEFPWGVQSVVWDVMTRRCGFSDCDLDVVDLKNADNALLGSVAKAYVVLKGDEDGFSRLLAQLQRDRREGRAASG
ncbi:nucleotidyltransferase family protein [Nitratifractor sp.]